MNALFQSIRFCNENKYERIRKVEKEERNWKRKKANQNEKKIWKETERKEIIRLFCALKF